ncbi:hypothetical protein HYH03_007573 [Edaphochlamys debaryana]|uniref:C-type lectin domain-containing protein n=1 Tax=Edaphochlamys debaryana TaxID=47281 RepID=A0A836BZR1_9CHLO|nr:hypothetical protein HYH03_007573 [Edaphochlamys debaryana]|eukprot:KAG2494217.1 hypothetical protein HYH03_007573 [Edaphochlamys debaryana]
MGTCIPGGRRCCDTAINKIKFFPSLGCRGSIESVLVNGNTIQSFTFELHEGFDILKVTPLSQWMPNPVDANHTIVCLNLRPPCWTARMLSYSGNNNRMEYALYDRKKDNYECCPVGIMDVPAGSTVPNFPPLPPPLGGGGGKRASPPPNGEIRRQPPPPRVKKQRSPSPPPAPSTPPSPPPPMPSTPPPPPRWWKPPPPSPAAKLTPKQGLKKRPPPPAGGKRSPRPPPPLNPSLPPPSPPPSVVPKKSPPPLPPPSPPPPVVGKASPPPPSPPPVVVGPGCRITVTMRRLVEVEPAFIDANCALLGAFVLLPLGSLGGVGYSCAFSSRTNVVITISGVPGADVRSLLGTYRDQPDAVGSAVAALGLSTCGQDSAVLSSPCAPNLSGTILSCSATDPVPAKSSPPPPPRPPPPRPPPSPPPPTIKATSPPPPPPDSTPVTQWTLYQDSVVFLLYFQAGTWAEGEKACAQMGGHLASVKDKGEYDFLVSFVQEYMPASGSLNAWFGLTTTTNAAGAAYTGANSDGSRMAFTPSSFAWDRTRNAVRNYMFACSKATGACSWTYGASAVEKQPAFLCRF